MPYTPPTQRSPATSKPNSPIISRTHSYTEQLPQAPVPSRPALPRSLSSTAYLHLSRRTHSTATAANTALNGQPIESDTSTLVKGTNGPVSSNHGAPSTPPDSSDDDDRGRSMTKLKELQDALQHIDIKRLPSPTRDGAADASAKPSQPKTLARSLSAEARKIVHSRSASDISLSQHNIAPLHTETVITSSDGSDEEDDELRIKPPLLRKKSGELVKPALRPTSRRRPSSMPGTPTYTKAVHFNEDMEQVRHFLQVDRPIAVSANSSPVETYDSDMEYPFFEDGRSKRDEWELKLANFPADSYERQTLPVRVERIFLASDNKNLVGTVAVANLAFQKLVVCRFTLDYWKTTSEVVAEFNHDVRKKQSNDGCDRFNFNIKLADQANLASKTLLLCVRYSVNGVDYWDNNNSINYQIDFVKKSKHRTRQSTGSLGVIPRSRKSPPVPRPRSMPVGSFDDDFGHSFEFGTSRAILGDSPNSSIKLKPKAKRGSIFPDQVASPSGGGHTLAVRYDFGASLSAALTTAQNTLGTQSGIKAKSNAAAAAATTPVPVPGTRPVPFPIEKPDLQSAEYNELIQKFCFFGTPNEKTPLTTDHNTLKADKKIPQQTEQVASESGTDSGSNQSSSSNSPSSPNIPLMTDGSHDLQSPTVRDQPRFLSRPTSPGPMTGYSHEDQRNAQFRGYSLHGGIFQESSHTPQACV